MDTSDAEYIIQQVEKRGYKIPEGIRPEFENHVRVLVERLQNQNTVKEDVEELEKQILPADLKNASMILEPLCRKYQVQDDKAEKALLAAYLSIAEKEK